MLLRICDIKFYRDILQNSFIFVILFENTAKIVAYSN